MGIRVGQFQIKPNVAMLRVAPLMVSPAAQQPLRPLIVAVGHWHASKATNNLPLTGRDAKIKRGECATEGKAAGMPLLLLLLVLTEKLQTTDMLGRTRKKPMMKKNGCSAGC